MTTTSRTATRTVTVDGIGPVPVTVAERGAGRPFLLLHGGGGPQSVDAFADLLAASGPARVLAPVHPGFGGTPRPDGLDSIAGLARLYAGLLDDLDLTGVIVVGNSIGGWIAAEIALLGSPRVGGVVLVDAAGLKIDAHPIAEFFSLTMDQVADLSYFRPDAFRVDLDRLPEPQKAVMATNRAALAVYGGTTMADPSLLGRLPLATVRTLVVWGEADRMIPPEHGRAYAAGLPGSRLVLIPEAGHLPQLERPDDLLRAVWDFAEAGGHPQHVHARPVRPLLPRPARHDRLGPAPVRRADRGRDGPVRDRARGLGVTRGVTLCGAFTGVTGLRRKRSC